MFGTMTVAIPTYRRYSGFLEHYLPKYLSMPEIDVIIIGDETGEDIERIKKQPWGASDKFVFIQNPERLGAYHNKINVLKHVTTDWVALIDSDNEILPEYFNGLYSYWNINGTNNTTVYIPSAIISYDNRNGSRHFPINHLAGTVVDKSSWNSFLTVSGCEYGLNVGNCVFHKDAYKSFSETEEKDIFVECKLMNKMLVENDYRLVFVPSMGYLHVVHNGSLYLNNANQMNHFNSTYKWTI